MTKLYLIPNFLSNESKADVMASYIAQTIKDVRVFFVEEPKAARSLLKKLSPDFPLSECSYIDLNEHTSLKEVEGYFKEHAGRDMAIISEAGYPCVADPGSALVRWVHQAEGQVIPLAGASSIILALAASGLNGQNFAFNGYLPKDRDQRLKKIKTLEQRSSQEGQTQIIMETPYRNQNILEDLLSACNPKTSLCIACDITGPSQMIHTLSVDQWKRKALNLPKAPTLFLLLYN